MQCFFFLIITQVNGKDVSNLAHEEAVNEFLNAPEPILVEVRRRIGQPHEIDSLLPPSSTSTSLSSSSSTTIRNPDIISATGEATSPIVHQPQIEFDMKFVSRAIQTDMTSYCAGGPSITNDRLDDDAHLNVFNSGAIDIEVIFLFYLDTKRVSFKNLLFTIIECRK